MQVAETRWNPLPKGAQLSGETLRLRRQGLGLTQAALANILGVSATSVARWERGEQRVGNPTVVRLALERLEASASSQLEAAGGQEQPTHNLPAEFSSFVGREDELARLKRLLSTSRLLTLAGPGGIGKSRLAMRLAEAALAEVVNPTSWLAVAAIRPTD